MAGDDGWRELLAESVPKSGDLALVNGRLTEFPLTPKLLDDALVTRQLLPIANLDRALDLGSLRCGSVLLGYSLWHDKLTGRRH